MSKLIVGCGYLGLRIAKLWAQRGETVHAMTRRSQRATMLADQGLRPFVGDVTDRESLTNIPSADTVVVAVGMDRSTYSDVEFVYVQGLQNLLQSLPVPPKQLVYISSTGVYGDFGGDWIDETADTVPQRPGGKACLKAEGLLLNSAIARQVTILRFAGIYGVGRVPTRDKIESGQWKKMSGAGYLNLIHVDDGARLVDRVVQSSPEGQTYNVSDGAPVLRQDYYGQIAKLLGLAEIPWHETSVDPATTRSGSNKRVSNQKLCSHYPDFKFDYPDYQAGLAQALGIKL